MDPTTMSVTERGAWNALLAHYQKVRDLDLRKFFTDDPTRNEPMMLKCRKADRIVTVLIEE